MPTTTSPPTPTARVRITDHGQRITPGSRKRKDKWFLVLCRVVTYLAVAILLVLLTSITVRAVEHLDWSFLTEPASRKPEKAGAGR